MRVPSAKRFTLTHVVHDRGIYCLLVVAHLLDLLTPELLDGTPAFIASCQTYEGGFSSASQPYFRAGANESTVLLDAIRPPLGEAHGGYTFCSFASWIMLQPYVHLYQREGPHPMVNYQRLMRWLVQLQGGEIELGGFRGRTNKLVDGCYSWWVGGCFALLASVGIGGGHGRDDDPSTDTRGDDGWDDVDGERTSIRLGTVLISIILLNTESVWSKLGLQRYILCAAQHPAGGLRDKPPKYASIRSNRSCL